MYILAQSIASVCLKFGFVRAEVKKIFYFVKYYFTSLF